MYDIFGIWPNYAKFYLHQMTSMKRSWANSYDSPLEFCCSTAPLIDATKGVQDTSWHLKGFRGRAEPQTGPEKIV